MPPPHLHIIQFHCFVVVSSHVNPHCFFPCSIGYAIAKRLGEEGAHVVISSRKQAHVDHALKTLKEANLSVSGLVCHVGKQADRAKLIETVR